MPRTQRYRSPDKLGQRQRDERAGRVRGLECFHWQRLGERNPWRGYRRFGQCLDQRGESRGYRSLRQRLDQRGREHFGIRRSSQWGSRKWVVGGRVVGGRIERQR
jgi:hypothetical protein